MKGSQRQAGEKKGVKRHGQIQLQCVDEKWVTFGLKTSAARSSDVVISFFCTCRPMLKMRPTTWQPGSNKDSRVEQSQREGAREWLRESGRQAHTDTQTDGQTDRQTALSPHCNSSQVPTFVMVVFEGRKRAPSM